MPQQTSLMPSALEMPRCYRFHSIIIPLDVKRETRFAEPLARTATGSRHLADPPSVQSGRATEGWLPTSHTRVGAIIIAGSTDFLNDEFPTIKVQGFARHHALNLCEYGRHRRDTHHLLAFTQKPCC